MSRLNDRKRIADVRCPYYARHTLNHTVVCEGVVEGSHLNLCFTGRERMDTHMEGRCMSRYSACPVCRMLETGYADD